MSTEGPDTLRLVRNEDPAKVERGAALEERARMLGVTPTDLVKMTGLSRQTVYNVFAGSAGIASFGVVEKALDERENHPGDHLPGPDAIVSTETGVLEFEITGDFGVRVFVRGPVSDAAEIERQAAKMIAEIRKGSPRAE